MITVSRLKELQEEPAELSAAVLNGENVLLRITRGGFSLGYLPMGGSELRTFAPVHPCSVMEMSRRPDCAVFSARQDDHFCALACVRDNGNGWAEIIDLRVDASCRRMGAGHALLESCRSFARRRQLGGLYAAVHDGNAVMCQFLEHEGFHVEGIDRLALALTP